MGPRAYMASAVLASSIISSLLAHTGQPPATGTVSAKIDKLSTATTYYPAPREPIRDGYKCPSHGRTAARVGADIYAVHA